MVAEERLAAIRGYVADVVGCAPGDVGDASRFSDGNRHDVYQVSWTDERGTTSQLVVRVSLVDDPAERAQAEREARVLEAVAGLSAPVLYDFSPRSTWFDTPSMSMSFVPGRVVSLAEASPAQIEQLGGLVADLHRHPVGHLTEQLGEEVDLATYASRRLRSTLDGLAWVRDPVEASLRLRLQDAASSLEREWERWQRSGSFDTGETVALLHGDIALGNVLWDPAPVLIDWEYTRLGDPADEIAYLFDQNGLTARTRTAFWRGYRAGSHDQDLVAGVIERVRWWEPLTLLGSTLWWVERWVRRTDAGAAGVADPRATREPGYYLDQVVGRLDRLGGKATGPPPEA